MIKHPHIVVFAATVLACLMALEAKAGFQDVCDPAQAERAMYHVTLWDEEGNKYSIGSAVAVSPDEAITAEHVAIKAPSEPFDDSEEFEYTLSVSPYAISDRAFPTYTIKTDDTLDLALIGGKFEHHLEIAQKIPHHLQKVYTLGFPYIGDIHDTGRLNGTMIWDTGYYQGQSVLGEYITTAKTLPGGSGGPLLVCEDGEFKVLGINVKYYSYITYSTTAGAVEYFIDEL